MKNKFINGRKKNVNAGKSANDVQIFWGYGMAK